MATLWQASWTGHYFGTHEPDWVAPSYERRNPPCTRAGLFPGWKGNLLDEGGGRLVANFINKLDDSGVLWFRYNLHGKQWYWETGGDQEVGSLERVDLFFAVTHGQAGPYDAYTSPDGCPVWPANPNHEATWAMWDWQTYARSYQMCLGNEQRGLSIFATYSCATAKWDADTANRWISIFSGGLRAALGFGHTDTIWCANYDHCAAQRYHGQYFAQYLIDGEIIPFAWIYSVQDGDSHILTPSAIVSGTDGNDCSYRRSNMTWYNFKDNNLFPRRTGMGLTLCGWYWTG